MLPAISLDSQSVGCNYLKDKEINFTLGFRICFFMKVDTDSYYINEWQHLFTLEVLQDVLNVRKFKLHIPILHKSEKSLSVCILRSLFYITVAKFEKSELSIIKAFITFNYYSDLKEEFEFNMFIGWNYICVQVINDTEASTLYIMMIYIENE